MDKLRWGILSTGNIANSFAQGLRVVEDAELVAVGSRSQDSADAFAQKYNIPHAHDSYQALADNPNVDVVYIGTPHVFHAENTLMCLEAGKHVLCEKPFTINASEAEQCVALAREKNLFLMEAIWMRFLPAIIEIEKIIKDGVIGDIQQIQADFSFYIPYDPEHRLFNLDLGGGALLDVGIYPISFTTILLGMPESIASHAILADSGADQQCTMLFNYSSASALLSAGIAGDLENGAVIKGTKGKIIVDPQFFMTTSFSVQLYGEEPQKKSFVMLGNGYNYEAQAVHDAIRAGNIEHERLTHQETITTMRLMDDLRQQWGVIYPQEA
ncbi:MAG: Gfo/Idh/MocA family oxidoreductase [Chloroflexota bacterium]